MNPVEHVTGLTLESWEIENPTEREKFYNADAVIDAYLKGEKDGLEQQQKLVLNTFRANVETSKTTTNKLYETLIKEGFKPQGAYIKFTSWSAFEALIAVPETGFIKDDFLKMYDVACALEDSVTDDLYSLNFSFIPVNDTPYEENVLSDGYMFRLKSHPNAQTARRA